MATAAEVFLNDPSTTVPAFPGGGNSDAPASGTVETWTVSSSAEFPAAVSASSRPTQFHIADPAQPGEIIAVTNVSGTTWTVTRGAEATTPVVHTAGATFSQVVTAGYLTSSVPYVFLGQAFQAGVR